MHSSTFSSDRQVPSGRWGLVWVAGLVLAGITMWRVEAHVRSLHYKPSVNDDKFLWVRERMRVSNDDPRTIAIVGASRSQLGFSISRMRKMLPDYTIAQLAVNGRAPIATLRDLAEDPSFRGIALVDCPEWQLPSSKWSDQQEWVEAYHRLWRTPGAFANRLVSIGPQAGLAFLAATGRRALRGLVSNGEWPLAPYIVTRADRSRSADYQWMSATEVQKKRTSQLPRKPSATALKTWAADVAQLEQFVKPIVQRGGQVVFVRMPTCDKNWELGEEYYPRDRFWDKFAESVTAPTIHFKDYPQLSGFKCPDWSHLDKRDAPRFTRGMLEVLAQKGILDPGTLEKTAVAAP